MSLPPAPALTARVVAHYSVFDIDELAPDATASADPRVYHVIRCPDWACVVPIAPDGRIVLVRQHRVGVNALTLEPPGGLMEPGQTPEQTAARELLEETGYAGRIESLGWVHPNPAILTNRVHLFVARDAVQVAEPTFDGQGEMCEVELLTRPELTEAMRSGRITHVIGLAALSAALALPVALRGSPTPKSSDPLDDVVRLLDQMEALQSRKVIELARRLRPDLTPEDIRNPHDFPELNDVDWHYADGHLSGIQSVIMAVRAMQNRQRDTNGSSGDRP
ncbi:MAG: NUDIX hydrolase [Deltaproteobacteria bacterium]|nr:NUDIX hydrolase [Deltaproteobacteria bacterium]